MRATRVLLVVASTGAGSAGARCGTATHEGVHAAQKQYAQAVAEKEDTLASTKRGGGLGGKLGVQTRVSLPMLETQQHRSQRTKSEAAQLGRLEELLRLRAANPKALSQALHLKPFEDVRSCLNQALWCPACVATRSRRTGRSSCAAHSHRVMARRVCRRGSGSWRQRSRPHAARHKTG